MVVNDVRTGEPLAAVPYRFGLVRGCNERDSGFAQPAGVRGIVEVSHDEEHLMPLTHKFSAKIGYMRCLTVSIKACRDYDSQLEPPFLRLSPRPLKPNPAKRWTWAFLTDALFVAVVEMEARTHQIPPARTILRNQWETPAHILVVRGQNDP